MVLDILLPIYWGMGLHMYGVCHADIGNPSHFPTDSHLLWEVSKYLQNELKPSHIHICGAHMQVKGFWLRGWFMCP